jgi:hypothetical protein
MKRVPCSKTKRRRKKREEVKRKKRGQRLRQETWERGMICKEHSETFRLDLAGSQSCPVELAQQPEARRASCRGNPHGEAKKTVTH